MSVASSDYFVFSCSMYCIVLFFQECSKYQKTIKGNEEEIKRLNDAIEFRDNFLAVSLCLIPTSNLVSPYNGILLGEILEKLL